MSNRGDYDQTTSFAITFLCDSSLKDHTHTITASIVFVIDNKQRVLAVHNKRGWDIPGGHRENNETPTETAHREVFEESCVEIKQLTPFALLENKNTAIVVFTAHPKKIHRFSPKTGDVITQRAFMPIQDFLHVYTGGDTRIMRQLIAKLAEHENRPIKSDRGTIKS